MVAVNDSAVIRQALAHDLDRQTKALATNLGEEIGGRTAIYLDTCFWIHLRDARLGACKPAATALLAGLTEAVERGHAFCPISESVIFELFKQSSRATKNQTAEIVDELSLGVAVIGFRERMATEVTHAIYTHSPTTAGQELYPLRQLVWTRGVGVMGIRSPYIEGLNLRSALDLQRRTVEHLWSSVSFKELLDQPAPWKDEDELASLAHQMNRDIARHRASLRSFRGTYADEAAGAADLCGDTAMEVMERLARSQGIRLPDRNTDAWQRSRREWCSLLSLALRKEPPRLQLRSLHAAAALHAAFRWNGGQKFDANDLYDFEHAGAALAYCHAFFTERPLHHMVTQRHVALDRLFGCQVFHTVEAANDYVADILSR